MTMSAMRMLFSLAWVGGLLIAASLQNAGGFSALYVSAAGMYAVAAIVTFATLPEPRATPYPAPQSSVATQPIAAEAATGPILADEAGEPVPEQPPVPAGGRDASARTIAGTIGASSDCKERAASAYKCCDCSWRRTDGGVGQAGLILGRAPAWRSR